MSIDTEIGRVRMDLAERGSIRAFRAGRCVLIVAEGELPTPGFTVDIEPSPLRIFPQQYNLMRHARPGTWPQIVTPYTYSEVVPFPADQPEVTVHHADGQDTVTIEEAGPELAAFTDVASSNPDGLVSHDEATGYSANLSFDEAFADALANLPQREPTHPDSLTSIKVVESGALFGGFPGFHHVYVRVQSVTT